MCSPAPLPLLPDAIVTGDHDLLALKKFEGIPIIEVREALRRLGLETA